MTPKQKAWKAFSSYIRARDCLQTTGTLERGVCITCGRTVNYRNFQAGHAIGGRNNAILFDEDLVHGQCVRCNIFLRGNYEVYAAVMISKYGLEKYQKMLKRKHKIVKYTEQDYLDIEKKYKQKRKELIENVQA